MFFLFCFSARPTSRSQLPSVRYDYVSDCHQIPPISLIIKYARIQSKGAFGEATIESNQIKTTAKKRTLELELRSRASLGSDISELVACRGLNEVEDASVDVVAHEAPAKVHVLGSALEVSVHA